MKELFEKVYINSEKDLPKVFGRYVFHDKIMGGTQEFAYPNNNPSVMNHLRNECDWYIMPIVMPTEEEVNKQAAEESRTLNKYGESQYDNKVQIACIRIVKWYRNRMGGGEK